MSDAAISALPGADEPLSTKIRTCIAPCVQFAQNVRVPVAAFGIPIASVAPPVPLGQFQSWIDLSTSPPALRMYIGNEWTAVYALGADGTVSMRAALSLPADPADTGQVATKNYVDARDSSVSGIMKYRGLLDCSANPNYPGADKGDVYIVLVAGRIGGASGINVGTATMLLCEDDGTASGPQATAGSHWTIVQGRNPILVQKFSGPTDDGSFAQFYLGSGKQIASSGIAFDTDATMAADSDACVPSQKAVKNSLGGQPLAGDALVQGTSYAWDGATQSVRVRGGDGRNLLVNSAFDIWQEDVNYLLGADALQDFVADFWKAGAPGMRTKTISRVAGLRGSRYAMKIQRVPGTVDAGPVRLVQQFSREESLALQGKPLTLSFDFMVGADYSGPGPVAGLVFGTGIDEVLFLYAPLFVAFPTNSGTTLPGHAGFNSLGQHYVNTLPAQVAPPGTVARLINQPLAIPVNWIYGATNEVALAIDFGSFAGQAGADDSVTIGNVKLEVGKVATPYEMPNAADELVRCQRRYRKSFALDTVPAVGVGIGTGEYRAASVITGTRMQSMGAVRFPAMRAWPVVFIFNPVAGGYPWTVRDFVAGDCGIAAVQDTSEAGFAFIVEGNPATVPGNTLGVHWVADARV